MSRKLERPGYAQCPTCGIKLFGFWFEKPGTVELECPLCGKAPERASVGPQEMKLRFPEFKERR